MSGFGERFRRAGYQVPKPLIEVEGRPIIAHVVEMFPGEADFIFICNEEHLGNPDYRMESVLRQICPTGRIIGIPAHKLGPVHAVLQVEQMIDPDRPVVVNYCDFTCYWAYEDFTHTTIFTAGSLYFVLRSAGFEQVKFIDPTGCAGSSTLGRILRRALVCWYRTKIAFWNRVTGSSFHLPSPQIFTFELKALAR